MLCQLARHPIGIGAGFFDMQVVVLTPAAELDAKILEDDEIPGSMSQLGAEQRRTMCAGPGGQRRALAQSRASPAGTTW